MKDIIQGIGTTLSGIFSLLFKLIMYVFKVISNCVLVVFGFNTRAKFIKTRFVVLAMIMGLITHPLYLAYAIKYPVSYAENMTRISFGMINLKNDVVRFVVPDKVENVVDKYGNRYGVKNMYNMGAEASGAKSVHWTHELMSPWQYLR